MTETTYGLSTADDTDNAAPVLDANPDIMDSNQLTRVVRMHAENTLPTRIVEIGRFTTGAQSASDDLPGSNIVEAIDHSGDMTSAQADAEVRPNIGPSTTSGGESNVASFDKRSAEKSKLDPESTPETAGEPVTIDQQRSPGA